MKIIVDENITLAVEAFSNFGEVFTYPGREITNSILKDADVLVVRSITNVNEDLLRNTKVEFVGTATIGFDHIDVNYLEENNIYFTTAIGCNSYAVAEYVMSSISYFCQNHNFSLKNKSIGIVGYGNIGKIVARFSKILGLNVLVNDPPLERNNFNYKFSSLEEVLNCDIITLHVPLNLDGPDKTVHLLNEKNINKIKSGSIVINSCRGPVVDNTALKNRLIDKKDLFTVFDVWENEPNADLEFLSLVNLATAHIAGYSYEGKINGTKIIADKLNSFLKSNINWQPPENLVIDNLIKINSFESEQFLHSVFNKCYDIKTDSEMLKNHNCETEKNFIGYFDKLRKTYQLRRELLNYKYDRVIDKERKEKLDEFRINHI